jgi:hypothetical protein
MSVVHDAVKAVGRFDSGKTRAFGGLICCIGLLLAGCGSSDNTSTSKELPVELRAPPVGSVRTADCRDWKKGTVAQRRSTVVALRKFAGGPVGSSEQLQNGPVLDDQRAYKVLQSYCKNFFARGFKLYKLYERAAAFVGH